MPAADDGAPPRDLVIDATPAPGDSSDGAGSAMAPFALTALGAGAVAKFVSPALALEPLGIAVLAFVALR